MLSCEQANPTRKACPSSLHPPLGTPLLSPKLSPKGPPSQRLEQLLAQLLRQLPEPLPLPLPLPLRESQVRHSSCQAASSWPRPGCSGRASRLPCPVAPLWLRHASRLTAHAPTPCMSRPLPPAACHSQPCLSSVRAWCACWSSKLEQLYQARLSRALWSTVLPCKQCKPG